MSQWFTLFASKNKNRKIENLLANLHHKREHVIHIRNFTQALNYGLILRNVRRAIKLKLKSWLKSYFGTNTELSKKAKKLILEKILIKGILTLKRLEGGRDPPCGISKNKSSRKRVTAWLFVTFNIINKSNLSWKFYWSSSNRSEEMKIFSTNINYFHQFFGFFDIFDILLQRN